MTLIAVVAAKGAPGATTTCAAMAAAGTIRRVPALLVELDPAGGSLALEAQCSLDPGLATMMAGARRGFDASSVSAHSQILANGVEVLFAPTSPERTHRIASQLATDLADALTERPGLTIVDCGRWDGDSALTPLLAAADHVVLVLRPTISGTEVARTRLPQLIDINANVAVLCVGDEPYSAHEVAAALGVPVKSAMAYDRRAARLVVSGVPLDRWLRRSPLIRSAVDLVDQLAANHRLAASVGR